MFSNAFCTFWKPPTRLELSPIKLRIMRRLPPAPGIKPTPASTKPIYSSAAATRAAAGAAISTPPPNVNAKGAATTGLLQKRIRCVVSCIVLIASSMASQFSVSHASNISARFAPAEKFCPWWPMTIPL